MIDKCESLADAAKRELREETAQIAETLAFVGLAKMKLKPDDRLEFGAIYACELERVQPFVANNEASKLMWWDVSSEPEEHITAIDRKLIEMTVGYRAI
ncbi:MAG: NUDIX domain-containing protein [Chloroflexota bacterium]